MKKFLSKKVIISNMTIATFALCMLMFMTIATTLFLQNRTLKADLQLAQRQAFIASVDFKGQNVAPVNISKMPEEMQIEVANLLPKSAFLQKK